MKKAILPLVLVLALLAPSNLSADIRPDYRSELTPYINDVCDEYGVCPELVEAIIECESSWNPNAKSGCGATGLMQIIGKYQTNRMDRLGVTDLQDPEQNILCGVDMIAEYMEQGYDVYEMLVIYRYGEYSKNYQEWSGESVAYADKVLEISHELETAHGK